MRNLTANALAKIAIKLGNEPVTIIEIDWVQDVPGSSYADRNVGNILGRILEVGALDNVVGISNNNSSQEIALKLDDTDGTIKAILDANDIHKRSARVYQWFEGMDIDDKFLIFSGKVSSPIKWSERERTVSFTVLSQLEDKEIGFSAEEGDFEWVPADLVGETWPMIFGTVQDVPCLQFNRAVTGRTLCGVGVISGEEQHLNAPLGGNDSAFYVRMAQMSAQASHLWQCWSSSCDDDEVKEFETQALDINSQMSAMSYQHWKSKECARLQRVMTFQTSIEESGGDALGCNPVRILGGEDFPQNTGIQLNIGQGIFTGHFEGDEFYITDRLHEDNESKAVEISYRNWEYWSAWNSHHALCSPTPPFASWKFETQLKCVGFPAYITSPDGIIRNSGSAFGSISDDETDRKKDQILQHYWAQAGSSVNISSVEEITYLISTIPGTVLALKAYKDFENERQLINVPSDLYEISAKDYGPISTIQVVFDRPLSTIPDQGWEDDLYVTFTSDVGPHTCDILEYIIDNFTDLSYDSTSFTAIRAKLDSFPMNFPILDRKNTIDVLQDIAFQARCALWLSNGTFYIKYLPEEPSSDDTIADSDVDAETGVNIELTSTEDLVTKMVINWRMSWAEDGEQRIILRHNVKKYGTQTEEFDFYCFSQPDIILKAATFWLIRMSNTWKRVSFKCYLNKLNLETFDTITLGFSGEHVSTANVKAIVEEASYNSADQTIDFTCLTPVKSGTMGKYLFFWPSAISPTEKFPTAWELSQGYAGGDGIGAEATGTLPIGYMDIDDWGEGLVWVGGPNVAFRSRSDHGDPTPTDVGFTAQSVIISGTYAELDISGVPNPDLQESYAKDTPLRDLESISDGLMINLHKTIILDAGEDGQLDPPRRAYLDSFFRAVNEDGDLVVDAENALWTTSEEEPDVAEVVGKPFDIRYHEEGEKYGAGTAFLYTAEESPAP